MSTCGRDLFKSFLIVSEWSGRRLEEEFEWGGTVEYGPGWWLAGGWLSGFGVFSDLCGGWRY